MKIINKSELTEDRIIDINKRVPIRYQNSWLEDCPDKIKTFIEEPKTEKTGLFLYGKCGTGKTYAMMAIKKNLLLREIQFKFWNSTELSATFREEAVSETYRNHTINNLMESDKLLLIDDFCAEKYSEFLEECFYRIINKCWNENIPVIISSNFSLKEISERIGDRIASRIAGMCEIIELTGKDKRIV